MYNKKFLEQVETRLNKWREAHKKEIEEAESDERFTLAQPNVGGFIDNGI